LLAADLGLGSLRVVGGFERSVDGDEGKAGVAQLVQQSVECGLVDDRSLEDCVALTVAHGHAVEADRPTRIESSLDGDLVPTSLIWAVGVVRGCDVHGSNVGAAGLSTAHMF
jgi:hypothetical protein